MWAVYENLPAATVLDGEVVRWAPYGRLDFTALQRRTVAARRDVPLMAREEPCHYVAFDVLKVGGLEVIGWPLTERRKILEELFASTPAAGVLALGMQTAEVSQALAWYHSLYRAGVEGLVIKPAWSRYEPGRRGWSKLNSVGVRAQYRESPLRVRRSSGVAAELLVGDRCRSLREK